MNPIIVNKESYFQFTMNAIACPLPRGCAFKRLGLPTKKGHKRGGCTGKASPKGDGMFANRTPIAKHQPMDSADITLARHRKTSKTSTHAPKKMEQLG